MKAVFVASTASTNWLDGTLSSGSAAQQVVIKWAISFGVVLDILSLLHLVMRLARARMLLILPKK